MSTPGERENSSPRAPCVVAVNLPMPLDRCGIRADVSS